MRKIILGLLTVMLCHFTKAQLTVYSDYNLQGVSGSCFIRTIYTGTNIPNGLNDGIKSISLSQGYMATLAENEDGSGERFTYMATKSNVNVNLAFVLQNKISFIRVLQLPSTPVKKKGSANTDNTITDSLNVTWFYDWGYKDYSTSSREFVPMAWGSAAASDANISSVIQKDSVTHYLAFNEPDNDGQSNLYVATAIPLYKKILSAGQRMCSPACTESQYRIWLDSFTNVANQQKLDIDVVCVHWYDWGNYTSTLNTNPSATDVFNRFKSYIDNVYNLYKKPIWITEFNANVNRPASVHEAFMQLALPWLDSDPRIERYSYFFGNDLQAYSASGVLSNGATIYANHASVDAYPDNVIDTRPAFPITLAAWNPSGLTQGGRSVSNYAPTSLYTNMTAPSGLTRGSGLTLPGTTASNGYWGANDCTTSTAATGVTANKFLLFSLKSNNNKYVNYQAIDKFNVRINSIGPIQYQIDYQINSGSFYPCATVTGPTRTTGNYTLGPIDLSDISGLQNVSPSNTITFRITPFDASGTGSSFLIGSGTTDTDPDLVITGGFSDTNFISSLSSNADLTALTTSSGTLSPTFATATTSYSTSVANSVSSITITATKADANAIISVRINNGSYANVADATASGALSLNVGVNTLDVRVTAQDGTLKTYTITVTRAASSNADLAGLTTSSGTLSPIFASNTNSYTASVTNSTSSVTITATKADNTATLQARVNSGTYTTITSGSPSSALSLIVGSNIVDVLVTAQDGTTKTYSITITRAASSNANLSALTISSGTLSPTFASGTITYAASVANTVSSVTVTPTRADANATIQVRINNGSYNSVTSGSASGTLTLNVGTNTLDVKVTAQDASTKTYTITVTRAQSSNANLSALTLSVGTLSPAFNSSTTSYTSTVSNSTSTITVTATKADANATIQVRVNSGTYVSLTSGVASSSLSISNIGTNPIDVRVTAQDGTLKTYTVTVTRLSANADLSALTISSGTLSPTFATATLSYSVSVANAVNTMTVTPTSLSTVATTEVRINGSSYTTVARTTASSALSLIAGTNTINVRVTSQDGLVTKTYTITVNRAINTWIGGTSTDFSNPLNWSANAVPNSIDNFTIASGTNNPVITGSISVSDFTINTGGSLTISGTLKIAGAITNNGSLTASAGTIEFNGTSAQTIPANTFANNTVSNLTINNSAGVSLAGPLRITGVLLPLAGTLTTGGNLTLVSSSIFGGGAIGQGNSNGEYISGTVTVQRFTQAQRGYRTISHPYTTSQSISAFTNKIRVTGLIANNGTYGVAAGAPQIFNYNPLGTIGNSSSILIPVTDATDATKWAAGKALYVFIRGNGNEGSTGAGAANYSGTINPVVLDVSGGSVNQGSITVPLGYGSASTDNFNLIGNPYPCPINLKNVIGINSFGTVYVYNPTKSSGLLDAYSVRGGFETYDNVSNPDIIIPTMGGFFIKATGSGQSLTFRESDKVTNLTPTYAVFGNDKKPKIHLSISTENGDVDDWKLMLNEASSTSSNDENDALKLNNSIFNFYSLSTDAKRLAIDYRSLKDVVGYNIPLGITTNIAGSYKINLASLTNITNTDVVLKDKFLNTEKILSNVGDSYSFTITNDSVTKGDNRFELELRNRVVNVVTNVAYNTLRIYPNPVKDVLYAQLTTTSNGNTEVKIVDMQGKVLKQQTIQTINGNTAIQLNATNLASGTYFLVANGDYGTLQQQFVKE